MIYEKYIQKRITEGYSMRKIKYDNPFSLIMKAIGSTRHEMWLSLQILLCITVVLSLIFFWVEHNAQPDVFPRFWQSVAWTLTRYVDNADAIVDKAPVTMVGKIVAMLLGIVAIAIVAIPAGLVASGFSEAYASQKRDRELAEFRGIIKKSFKTNSNRDLRLYLESLPDDGNAWYSGVQFNTLTKKRPFSFFQIKGLEFKDIVDTCLKYPEFRIKNETAAMNQEEIKVDRFVVEYIPINRSYGYFVDRGSKVTIVSTSSKSEYGTGYYAYYLAKFAGFNYISKDFDIDDDESESFYNNKWIENTVNGTTFREMYVNNVNVDTSKFTMEQKKQALRAEFLSDLESVCKDTDTWVICILGQQPTQDNSLHFHIANSLKDGSESTVHDTETFERLVTGIKKEFNEKFGLNVENTVRFPLIKAEDGERNIIYKLQEDGCGCNGMTFRITTKLINNDSRMRKSLFVLAKAIKDVITPESLLTDEEKADLNRSGWGYSEHELEK